MGATTRQPEELPAALRSRCVELFFRPLAAESLEKIALNAAIRLGYEMEDRAIEACAIFCNSGRDVVNMIQIAGGAAYAENRGKIILKDIEWVTEITNCSRRYTYKMPAKMKPGMAVGLAVANGMDGHGAGDRVRR